jgi:hypothetical protein
MLLNAPKKIRFFEFVRKTLTREKRVFNDIIFRKDLKKIQQIYKEVEKNAGNSFHIVKHFANKFIHFAPPPIHQIVEIYSKGHVQQHGKKRECLLSLLREK